MVPSRTPSKRVSGVFLCCGCGQSTTRRPEVLTLSNEKKTKVGGPETMKPCRRDPLLHLDNSVHGCQCVGPPAVSPTSGPLRPVTTTKLGGTTPSRPPDSSALLAPREKGRRGDVERRREGVRPRFRPSICKLCTRPFRPNPLRRPRVGGRVFPSRTETASVYQWVADGLTDDPLSRHVPSRLPDSRPVP